MKELTRCLIFLCVVLSIQLVHAKSDKSKCARLVKPGGMVKHTATKVIIANAGTTPVEALSAAEQSYLRLLEDSVKNRFITLNVLRATLSSLESGKVINPLVNINHSAASKPYFDGFNILLKKSENSRAERNKLLAQRLIKYIEKIVRENIEDEEKKLEVKEETVKIFSPHVYKKMQMKNISLKSSCYFVAED